MSNIRVATDLISNRGNQKPTSSLLTFLNLQSNVSTKNNKVGSDLIRFRGVNGCFRARVICQMKEEKIRNKMVVFV